MDTIPLVSYFSILSLANTLCRTSFNFWQSCQIPGFRGPGDPYQNSGINIPAVPLYSATCSLYNEGLGSVEPVSVFSLHQITISLLLASLAPCVEALPVAGKVAAHCSQLQAPLCVNVCVSECVCSLVVLPLIPGWRLSRLCSRRPYKPC